MAMTSSDLSSICLRARFHSRPPSEASPKWKVRRPSSTQSRASRGFVFHRQGRNNALGVGSRTTYIRVSWGSEWWLLSITPKPAGSEGVWWKMGTCSHRTLPGKLWSRGSLRNIQVHQVRGFKGEGDLLETSVTNSMSMNRKFLLMK